MGMSPGRQTIIKPGSSRARTRLRVPRACAVEGDCQARAALEVKYEPVVQQLVDARHSVADQAHERFEVGGTRARQHGTVCVDPRPDVRVQRRAAEAELCVSIYERDPLELYPDQLRERTGAQAHLRRHDRCEDKIAELRRKERIPPLLALKAASPPTSQAPGHQTTLSPPLLPATRVKPRRASPRRTARRHTTGRNSPDHAPSPLQPHAPPNLRTSHNGTSALGQAPRGAEKRLRGSQPAFETPPPLPPASCRYRDWESALGRRRIRPPKAVIAKPISARAHSAATVQRTTFIASRIGR